MRGRAHVEPRGYPLQADGLEVLQFGAGNLQFGRKGVSGTHSQLSLFTASEAVGDVARRSHAQMLGYPLPGCGGLGSKAPGNPQLLRVSLSALIQLFLLPTSTIQFLSVPGELA